jgi:uncharacterized protein
MAQMQCVSRDNPSLSLGDAMLQSGKAVKVTIYLCDAARHRTFLPYTDILDYFLRRETAGATATKGVGGFGHTHRIHSASILEISDHLPLKIQFVDAREKVDAILPELEKRIRSGLIEVQETSVIVPGPH